MKNTNYTQEKENAWDLKTLKQCGFIETYKDNTKKVQFMRYCNNCLSYGYNMKTNTFYLCKSPILECSILEILSSHNTFEELKEAFYIERNKI